MLNPSFKRKTISAAIALSAAALGSVQAHAVVLEEVIVEAQKKSETVTETPIAIQVMTGEQLQKYAGFAFTDLARTTPGLTMSPGATPDLRMRGISSVTQGPVSLRTNIYQDNLLLEPPRTAFDTQFDIASFEVLKGAQGTLYSKSSPVGTINIRTKNPDLAIMDGYVSVSLGERNLTNTQGGISIPIIENELAVRLSGYYDQNQASGVENITTGHDSLARGSGGRIVILWEPNDDFTARSWYQYRDKNENIFYATDGAGIDAEDLEAHNNVEDYQHYRDQQAGLEVSYAISDHLSLTSVTGYLQQHTLSNQDTDALAQPIDLVSAPALGNTLGDYQETLSILRPIWQQDLRLSSEDNDFWDWQAGFFYERRTSRTSVATSRFAGGAAPTYLNLNIVANTNRENLAYYTHQTFKFTDNFNIVAGLRYTEERYHVDQSNAASARVLAGGTLLNLTSQQLIALGRINAQGVRPELQTDKDYPVVGTLKAQYFFTPDSMGYVTFDRAYRTGIANIDTSGTLPGDLALIEPESALSLEVGYKSNFADGAGRYAIAVFDQRYKDFQQDVANVNVLNTTNGTLAPLNNAVQNADEAETRGVEFNIAWQLLDNWSVELNTAYTDSKFKSFDNAMGPISAACPQSTAAAGSPYVYGQCDLSGERLPLSPHWSGNISTEYSLPAFADASWYVSGLVNVQSNQVDKLTRETLPGFSTVDLFTGLRSESGWDLKLWVKNAFDKRSVTRVNRVNMPTALTSAGTTDFSQPTFDQVVVTAPRQVGVTGRYSF